MIALDGAASAQLASQIKGVAWFVDLNFLSGSLYYNTTAESYVVDGHNYQGIGGLTDISQIHESDSATPSKITLSFALTKRSLIAATIGNAAEYSVFALEGKGIVQFIQGRMGALIRSTFKEKQPRIAIANTATTGALGFLGGRTFVSYENL